MAHSLSAVVGPVVASGAMTATSSVALMWFAAGVGGVDGGIAIEKIASDAGDVCAEGGVFA